MYIYIYIYICALCVYIYIYIYAPHVAQQRPVRGLTFRAEIMLVLKDETLANCMLCVHTYIHTYIHPYIHT